VCGTTDKSKFYKKRKNKCKKCISNEYKNRPDKEKYVEKQKRWVNNNIIQFRVLAAKYRSIKHNLSFELTNDIIEKKLLEQNNKCYISKQPISMETNSWYSLSLDRLNNDEGYTINNTIIVTKFVNIGKNSLQLNEYLKLLSEVCDNQ